MTPPSPNTQNSNPKNGAAAAPPAPAPVVPAPEPKVDRTKDKLKPVTILIGPETHKRLRVVALSKGTTASALCESYIDAALKRDMAVALAKLSDE